MIQILAALMLAAPAAEANPGPIAGVTEIHRYRVKVEGANDEWTPPITVPAGSLVLVNATGQIKRGKQDLGPSGVLLGTNLFDIDKKCVPAVTREEATELPGTSDDAALIYKIGTSKVAKAGQRAVFYMAEGGPLKFKVRAQSYSNIKGGYEAEVTVLGRAFVPAAARAFKIQGANDEWTPTEMIADPGDTMVIIAKGKVVTGAMAGETSADGHGGPCVDSDSDGALIFKIGTATVAKAGTIFFDKVAVGGPLKLKVRDTKYSDNKGEFAATVFFLRYGHLPAIEPVVAK